MGGLFFLCSFSLCSPHQWAALLLICGWAKPRCLASELLSLNALLLGTFLAPRWLSCCAAPGAVPSQLKWDEMKLLSRVWLFATPWTVTYKAPLSTEFSRQEYWSGLPFPSPGDLPSPGIEPGSPALRADALPSEPPGKPIPGGGAISQICVLIPHTTQ